MPIQPSELRQETSVDELLHADSQQLARLAEACGALVIGYAVLRAAILFVLNVLQGPVGEVPNEVIRFNPGRSLALGLELLRGGDILNPAVASSSEQAGLLAAIGAEASNRVGP